MMSGSHEQGGEHDCTEPVHMLPAAPNWYCCSVSDCSLDGYFGFGAKNDIHLLHLRYFTPRRIPPCEWLCWVVTLFFSAHSQGQGDLGECWRVTQSEWQGLPLADGQISLMCVLPVLLIKQSVCGMRTPFNLLQCTTCTEYVVKVFHGREQRDQLSPCYAATLAFAIAYSIRRSKEIAHIVTLFVLFCRRSSLLCLYRLWWRTWWYQEIKQAILSVGISTQTALLSSRIQLWGSARQCSVWGARHIKKLL